MGWLFLQIAADVIHHCLEDGFRKLLPPCGHGDRQILELLLVARAAVLDGIHDVLKLAGDELVSLERRRKTGCALAVAPMATGAIAGEDGFSVRGNHGLTCKQCDACKQAGGNAVFIVHGYLLSDLENLFQISTNALGFNGERRVWLPTPPPGPGLS